MKKLSKRQKKIKSLITNDSYTIDDALSLLQKTATAKFIESAEVHISLNIDPKYGDQQLRTTLVLPKGNGKTKKIAVLVPTEKITTEYQELADIIGSDNLIESMNSGNLDFDLLIATPDMMPKLAKLGKVLGPKGLMPSPKAGTVTQNITDAILEFKKGKVEYRADKTGIVHLTFGKMDFSLNDLKENLMTIYHSVEQNKPSGVKGKYFKNMYLTTTMGPSIKIDLTTL